MLAAVQVSITNTKVTFVHYKSASAMYTDFFAGRVQASPSSLFTGLPYARSGKLRPVAILSGERSAFLPGMKTVDGLATFGPVKNAWCKDSEGNIIGFVEGM